MVAKVKRTMEDKDIGPNCFWRVIQTHIPQKMNFHPMRVTVTVTKKRDRQNRVD
jgi:hypothetical protein